MGYWIRWSAVAVILGLVTACGGGGGSGGSTPTGDTTFDGPIAVSMSEDGNALIAVDDDSCELVLQQDTVTWMDPGGREVVLHYGSDGWPTRMVSDGGIICYGDWDTAANTVNVGFIHPDGTTTTEHDVPMDAQEMADLATLIGMRPAWQAMVVGDGTGALYPWTREQWAWGVGYAGALLGAAGCGAALAAAGPTFGLSWVAAGAACGSTVTYIAKTIKPDVANNNALRATEGGLLGYDIAKCVGLRDVSSCVGIILQATEQAILHAEDVVRVFTAELDVVVPSLQHGGGAVQVTLTWARGVDLDLHVRDAAGEEIYYAHSTSASGGYLDHDDIDGGTATVKAIENVFWQSSAPAGSYQAWVRYFSGSGTTPFTLTAWVNGEQIWTQQGSLGASGQDSPSTPFTVP